ncbi:MAG: glutamate 5-kinase [Acidimicrobiales bacterium]
MSRIVVKIGTSSLTDESGAIDSSVMERVASEVAVLRARGHQVTLVTSGAIAAGLPRLGMDSTRRPTDAVTLQAASSVGQPLLQQTWYEALSAHGLVAGQILLAPHNFGDRAQYLHARSTLQRLLELGAVPVINENDAVTDDEIRFGDNDRIAALVATLVGADTLVLLTDTDGVLTADPKLDPQASLIEEIVHFDHQLDEFVGGAGTARGSGGMASKLLAARIAAWSGVRTVIAHAGRSDVIAAAVDGVEGVGTTVVPRDTKLPSRKLWIGFAMPAVATITVDAGARAALVAGGRSLLAAGVNGADGTFERRDPVEIADETGEVFAKGISRMTAVELEAVKGTSGAAAANDELPRLVVHADDLVVLG